MTEQAQDASGWPPRNVLMSGAVTLRGDRALFVSQTYGSLRGQWGIPWGVVEAGESPAVAALRETREEGGIVARIEGLIGLECFSWESAVGLVFLCRHVSGEPMPDGQETDRAVYFSVVEMDKADQPFAPWSERLVRRVLRGEHHLIPVEPGSTIAKPVCF